MSNKWILKNWAYFLPSSWHSVTNSCPTLCDPTNCSALGFLVPHCLLEFEGLLWKCGLLWPAGGTGELAPTVLGGTCWHKSFLKFASNPTIEPIGSRTPGQTTNREEIRSHPSADYWIKDLLSKALPTRARPSFPHSQPLPLGSLQKPLIHQRADRSKNYNPTASRNKSKPLTWVWFLAIMLVRDVESQAPEFGTNWMRNEYHPFRE